MHNDFHSLLKRQVKKYLPERRSGDNEILPFIDVVNETYRSNDMDRSLLENSLEISSGELMQKNSEIRTIFQAFPDIFFRISLDGRILDYKSASINISQMLPDQLVGRYIQEITILKMDSVFEGTIKNARQVP